MDTHNTHPNGFIVNPHTNRLIRVGSRTHRMLLHSAKQRAQSTQRPETNVAGADVQIQQPRDPQAVDDVHAMVDDNVYQKWSHEIPENSLNRLDNSGNSTKSVHRTSKKRRRESPVSNNEHDTVRKEVEELLTKHGMELLSAYKDPNIDFLQFMCKLLETIP